MKFLIALLMLLPAAAFANDMLEVDAGFGQGTKPFYGADYEFNKDLPYLDLSLTGNSQYIQPYVSFGLQFEHVNVGIAQAVTISDVTNGGSPSAQYGFGPEFGFMQNITPLLYVKENNSYLYSGSFNFACTFSIGINL
jgi:hypothetical protein